MTIYCQKSSYCRSNSITCTSYQYWEIFNLRQKLQLVSGTFIIHVNQIVHFNVDIKNLLVLFVDRDEDLIVLNNTDQTDTPEMLFKRINKVVRHVYLIESGLYFFTN